MNRPDDLEAARRLTANAVSMLSRIPAYEQMTPDQREHLRTDLARIESALGSAPPDHAGDPYAFPFADERRSVWGTPEPEPRPSPPERDDPAPQTDQPKRPPGTEAVAARAGALLDELDFPTFVASLIHGTFDAVVDATIRQLEAFADLVSSVAQSVDEFTAGNVTPNQARDWLVERYPGDLRLDLPQTRDASPTVRVQESDDFGAASPAWLSDFDLAGEQLTDELAESRLVPAARRQIGEQRLQLLATMVLLGMNRVTVSDGRITARLMFRAAARDSSAVDFAVSQDPKSDTWGSRGSETYEQHSTMVSTVGVNAQSDVELRADLYGSVELNFVSETLPLDQFADQVQLNLLQRNARWTPPTTTDQTARSAIPATAAPVVQPAPAPTAPGPSPAPQPADPQPPASQPAPTPGAAT